MRMKQRLKRALKIKGFARRVKRGSKILGRKMSGKKTMLNAKRPSEAQRAEAQRVKPWKDPKTGAVYYNGQRPVRRAKPLSKLSASAQAQFHKRQL